MKALGETRAIHCVWFDQDDTLCSYHDAMRRALNACLAIIHEHFPGTRETPDGSLIVTSLAEPPPMIAELTST